MPSGQGGVCRAGGATGHGGPTRNPDAHVLEADASQERSQPRRLYLRDSETTGQSSRVCRQVCVNRDRKTARAEGSPHGSPSPLCRPHPLPIPTSLTKTLGQATAGDARPGGLRKWLCAHFWLLSKNHVEAEGVGCGGEEGAQGEPTAAPVPRRRQASAKPQHPPDPPHRQGRQGQQGRTGPPGRPASTRPPRACPCLVAPLLDSDTMLCCYGRSHLDRGPPSSDRAWRGQAGGMCAHAGSRRTLLPGWALGGTASGKQQGEHRSAAA
ncbi:uncharacterized protein LOC121480479 [Vulpes lagopus]|uniref:uncharacterized protein LOC121480479 n=1 Tax=Vulpes lagopus TaxID=494514 RepID=UPI001BCA21F1|nr:uncharacterized protein LOC121480479 [Vulpes lagopus]